MAQCAIISDIHGNIAALEAVLADIENVGVEEIWCLGDMVGYGPDPVACYKRVTEACGIVIRGNHERALTPGNADRFNIRARRAIEWTREQFLKEPDGEAMLQAIQELPSKFERRNILFVHGSPKEPTEEYLMPKDARNRTKLAPQWPLMKQYAFCGHTHYPGVIEQGQPFVPPEDMLMNVYMLDYEGQMKAIINVGSVGQPRDRNPQSCYVTFDGDSVVYRRVKYDAKATARKIYLVNELDDFLGDRILEGK